MSHEVEFLPLPPHPPLLDSDAMPPELARVVFEVARATQTPPAMPFAIALACLATATRGRWRVRGVTHDEPSVLWTAVIAPPGSRKSAVFSILTPPLFEAEERLVEEWKQRHREWRANVALAEDTVKRARKEDRGAYREAVMELERLRDEEPLRPVLVLSEGTPEAIRNSIERGAVGLLSAEGASIFEAFGRYSQSKGAELAFLLAGHAGDAVRAARVDGIRGTDRALLSIGVALQPDVLSSLAADRMAVSRGLLDRLLIVWPKDNRGERRIEVAPLDPAIASAWREMILRIAASEGGTVELGNSAKRRWVEFAEETEHRMGPGGDLREHAGFASKLPGAVLRIALLYHLADDRGGAIDGKTMEQAIAAGHFLLEHTMVARIKATTPPKIDRAARVLELLQAKAEKHAERGIDELPEITVREIMRRCSWARTADEVRAVMAELADRGLVGVAKKRKGKPTAWRATPAGLLHDVATRLGLDDEEGGASMNVNEMSMPDFDRKSLKNKEKTAVCQYVDDVNRRDHLGRTPPDDWRDLPPVNEITMEW